MMSEARRGTCPCMFRAFWALMLLLHHAECHLHFERATSSHTANNLVSSRHVARTICRHRQRANPSTQRKLAENIDRHYRVQLTHISTGCKHGGQERVAKESSSILDWVSSGRRGQPGSECIAVLGGARPDRLRAGCCLAHSGRAMGYWIVAWMEGFRACHGVVVWT